MVKISVVIPMYGYAQYLDEAIQSVLNQSYPAHEIICVSDGAIDNSVEIAKKYPVIVIEKENGGLSSARNAGIEVATGDFIVSFDSDDIMRPDCLLEHAKLANENTIVTCGLMAFGNESYTARPKVATVDILLKTNCIYSNSLFSRAKAIEVGGFDECDIMRLGLEDWEFWIRMAKAGVKFKVSNYIGLLWRRHPNTMSSSSANPNWNKITDYIKTKHGIK